MNEDIISRARQLFQRLSDAYALQRLEKIEKSILSPKFAVCIAGGFSRGKTHLLNQLLNTDIFPEDVVPATTVLTEVTYGDPASMVFAGLEKKINYEPSTANMEKFCAGNELADAEGVLCVGYPAEFLKDGLAIYDTPGIDDILATRADVTFDALENSDAALVVTSANAPLALNERQFIAGYLFNRHIPKIALVVTFLDQLDHVQQVKQLANIKHSAHGLFPGMEIWCAISNDATATCDAHGVAAMRARLYEWAKAGDLRKLRSKKGLVAIAQLLRAALSLQEGFLENLSGDLKQRELKLREAGRALREKADSWNALRGAFMDKGIARAENLQARIAAMAPALREAAEDDSSQNPAAALRDKARAMREDICETLRQSIHEDKAELLSGIRKQYDFIPDLRANVLISGPGEMDLPDESGNLPNLRGVIWQALDFLRAHVDDIANVLPLPPVPRQIARKVATELLEKGKELIGGEHSDKSALDVEIDRFCASLEREIMDATRSVYAEIADQVREGQVKWLETQKRELDINSGAGDVSQKLELCSSNIAAIKALLAEINVE